MNQAETATAADVEAGAGDRSRWLAAWLMSTVAHTAILLFLALGIDWRPGAAAQSNSSAGMSVQAILVAGDGTPEGGDDGQSGLATAFEPGALADAAVPAAPPEELRDLAPQFNLDPALAHEAETQKLREAFSPRPPADLVSLASANDSDAVGARAALRDAMTRQAASENSRDTASGGVARGEGPGAGRGRGYGLNKVGEARTGIFGVEGQGHKFIYVFDRSGSMDGYGGAPIVAAKEQLLASIQDLGKTHQFQIIFYNDTPRAFNPSGVSGRLVFANDQNKELASKFVRGVTPDGGTEHEGALAMALRLAPDVVFFLTDADEPAMTAAQMDRITHLNRGTVINAIQFGYGAQVNHDSFLAALAHKNGGKHVYIDVSRLPRPR